MPKNDATMNAVNKARNICDCARKKMVYDHILDMERHEEHKEDMIKKALSTVSVLFLRRYKLEDLLNISEGDPTVQICGVAVPIERFLAKVSEVTTIQEDDHRLSDWSFIEKNDNDTLRDIYSKELVSSPLVEQKAFMTYVKHSNPYLHEYIAKTSQAYYNKQNPSIKEDMKKMDELLAITEPMPIKPRKKNPLAWIETKFANAIMPPMCIGLDQSSSPGEACTVRVTTKKNRKIKPTAVKKIDFGKFDPKDVTGDYR